MTTDLPPLPTSQMLVDVWDSEVKGLHQANQPYYTADQLRSFALEAVRMERERMDWLAPPHTSRFVEQENGMFRVYEDVAMQGDPRHKWQAITTRWYPTPAEAIDEAIRSRSEEVKG